MFCVPYVSVVGSLMYVMLSTRVDIVCAMGVLRRYMSKLGKEHWIVVNRVFRYLCGTKDHAISHQERDRANKVLDVHVFVDINWVGDMDHIRSTSGYVFNLFGGAIN